MDIGVTGRDPKGGWVYGGTIVPGASMLSRGRPWDMVIRCVTVPIGVVIVIVSECSLLSSMR